MKRHQYRCNTCLILEERWLREGVEPFFAVPCPKCAGLAIKLPTSDSMSKIFADLARVPLSPATATHTIGPDR